MAYLHTLTLEDIQFSKRWKFLLLFAADLECRSTAFNANR